MHSEQHGMVSPVNGPLDAKVAANIYLTCASAYGCFGVLHAAIGDELVRIGQKILPVNRAPSSDAFFDLVRECLQQAESLKRKYGSHPKVICRRLAGDDNLFDNFVTELIGTL